MDGIEIDGDALREDAATVDESREAVLAAAGVLATLAEAIGHPQLAAVARDVAARWEDARFAVEAEAADVVESLRTIAEVAAQIDDHLARAASAVQGRRQER